jgi:phage-related holin
MTDRAPPISVALVAAWASLTEWWPVKAALATGLATFGPMTDGHRALFLALLLDLITGIAVAVKKHTLSSAVMRQRTLSKLFAYGCLLALVYWLERAIAGGPYEFASNLTLNATLIYLVVTESVSVLENVAHVSGIRLSILSNPAKLIARLQEEKDEGNQPKPAP